MNKIDCKECKAQMKKVGLSRKSLRFEFWWCPECGTFLKYEYGNNVEFNWYKPGYLFEQETS